MDEKEERKDKRQKQVMAVLMFVALGALVAFSFVEEYQRAEELKPDWPTDNIRYVGEDEQYRYYVLQVLHARYDDAIEYIKSIGGEITDEKIIIRWYDEISYKVAKK